MVAVTIDLASYRATVHYVHCSYYKTTHTHLNREVPPSIKWRLCSFCKPVREDIASIAYDIRWLHKRADVMNLGHNHGTGMLVSFSESMEHDLAQRELNGHSVVRDRLK